MIYVECKPDGALVRTLTTLPKKAIIHEIKGKFGVLSRLSRASNISGLIDEDPGAIQPEYLTSLTLKQEIPQMGLKLLHDPTRNNYLVILCPRLEEWIAGAANESKISLGKYNLPSDPGKLHADINTDLRKFERLARGLRTSQRLMSLSNLLKQTQHKSTR